MITQPCEMTKRMWITELIGLGETQRRIYEKFMGQPEATDRMLRCSYEHHCIMLESLIKYQERKNGR